MIFPANLFPFLPSHSPPTHDCVQVRDDVMKCEYTYIYIYIYKYILGHANQWDPDWQTEVIFESSPHQPRQIFQHTLHHTQPALQQSTQHLTPPHVPTPHRSLQQASPSAINFQPPDSPLRVHEPSMICHLSIRVLSRETQTPIPVRSIWA